MSAQPFEIRIARLEGALEQLPERMNDLRAEVNARFGQVDRRLDGIDQRFDQRFDSLGRKIDGLQWRMIALIVGTWITVMLTVLFHH